MARHKVGDKICFRWVGTLEEGIIERISELNNGTKVYKVRVEGTLYPVSKDQILK